MSEPIKVGDLVMVVRNHDCNITRGAGYIFTVERIELAYSFGCRVCGTDLSDGRLLAYGRVPKRYGYHPLSWLKRIDPLNETETEEHDEEISA